MESDSPSWRSVNTAKHGPKLLPHPVRLLYRSAVVVLSLALPGLVLVGLGSRSRTVNDADLTYVLACTALLSGILAMATSGPASRHLPVLRSWGVRATTLINRPPDQVWAFIRAAETMPLVQPEVMRGFSVPGTPRGVGEQQAFIQDGPAGMKLAGVVEVTEEHHGVYAATQNVTGLPGRQTFRVDPVPGGTTLTYTLEISGARWAAHPTHPRKQAAVAAQRYVESVKRVIESQPPAPPAAPQPPLGPPPLPPQAGSWAPPPWP